MKKVNVIEIDINNKDNIFNEFNKNQISNELAQYILTNSKKASSRADTKIIIHQNIFLTNEEQEQLVDAIREYFGLLVREKIIYSKVSNKKQVILFIIGILLIVLSELLSNVFKILISELLLIAGWVAIWEMLDSVLFVDGKNNYEKIIYKKLSICEIEFK